MIRAAAVVAVVAVVAFGGHAAGIVVDRAQVVNGSAGLIAAVIWWQAIAPTIRMGYEAAAAVTATSFAVSGWYAATNFLLGFGLWRQETMATIPYFRYAFPFMVLAPAIRRGLLAHISSELLAVNSAISVEGLSDDEVL